MDGERKREVGEGEVKKNNAIYGIVVVVIRQHHRMEYGKEPEENEKKDS